MKQKKIIITTYKGTDTVHNILSLSLLNSPLKMYCMNVIQAACYKELLSCTSVTKY